MSRAWWFRISIVALVLVWAVYVLTPTFLAESAQDRLSAQADAAQSAADRKLIEEDDRLPEAEHLPSFLLNPILNDLKNCRAACKGYSENPSEYDWVKNYHVNQGKSAQARCARKELSANLLDECAIESLRSCTKTCAEDVTGGHSESECADACLAINNEQPDAPDWAAAYYQTVVNSSYTKCVAERSKPFLEGDKCTGQLVSACVDQCRESGEEELSIWSSFVIGAYPKSKLSLGLDLQGGIDMDLEVEIEEAVRSSVQRDIATVRQTAEAEGLMLGEMRRAPGESILMIEPGEGVQLSSIRSFMTKNFNEYTYNQTLEEFGKTYFTFGLSEEQAKYISERAIEQALETLRSRIDETGVKEPSIVLKGGNRINIQLPGIEDVEQAVSAIGTSAVLDFMMVDEDTMKNPRDIERALFDAEKELSPEEYLDDGVLSDHLVRNGSIPATSRLMWEYKSTEQGKERTEYMVVVDQVELTGDDINDALVSMNQYNEPYVALEFKPRGAVLFADLTAEHVGKRFAIVLDKEVRSAPVIREKISGGRASIEMGVTDYQMAMQEASVLSLVLRTGALPAPVSIGKVRTVGSSLGEDAINAGKEATFVGFGLVLVLMVLLYKKTGLVSVVALLANIVLVFALLSTAGATLTLPGIAGIALTIGMAVDCNIIIYERIIEELRTGTNARAAVETGFDKALLAVVDANITTFIAGVVLYTYGTGPIKGFAVTLMIGIVTTLFTGVFLSRTLMGLLTRKANARLSI
ncbi:MAG: protein translocase subunit SecD [Proteobacteria bacterium]|nr:protein translocase subunit SecD [Pseudomonadota bacterium]